MTGRLPVVVVMAVAGLLVSTWAMAQGVPGLAPMKPLKTQSNLAGRPKYTRRGSPPPAATTEEAERAARLAENRRRFFEDQQTQDTKPKPVPEFGGYDAATMSGTLSPGFKF